MRTHGILPHEGEFIDSAPNETLKIISKIEEEHGEFGWEPDEEGTFVLRIC